MRRMDEEKSVAYGKAAKTINFDKIVLIGTERRAKEEGTSVSHMLNDFCRRKFLSDAEFFSERARYHNTQMHDCLFKAKRAKEAFEIVT